MAIDGVGAVAQQNSATDLRNAGVSQEDFLKILLAQLSFQDPLKPMDNQEFIAQLAQFSSLELNRQNNEKVDTMLTFQSVNQAIGLIGKTVDLTTSAGTLNNYTVTTVAFNNGVPLLSVTPNPAGSGDPITGVSLSQISIVR